MARGGSSRRVKSVIRLLTAAEVTRSLTGFRDFLRQYWHEAPRAMWRMTVPGSDTRSPPGPRTHCAYREDTPRSTRIFMAVFFYKHISVSVFFFFQIPDALRWLWFVFTTAVIACTCVRARPLENGNAARASFSSKYVIIIVVIMIIITIFLFFFTRSSFYRTTHNWQINTSVENNDLSIKCASQGETNERVEV